MAVSFKCKLVTEDAHGDTMQSQASQTSHAVKALKLQNSLQSTNWQKEL